MTRVNYTNGLRLFALAIIVTAGASSCKNKQKMSELSDKDEIEEQLRIFKEEEKIILQQVA